MAGTVTDAEAAQLRGGVEIETGTTRQAGVFVMERLPDRTRMRVTLREGRKRQVRAMIEAIGHKVIRLQRIREGPLHLGDLGIGKYRRLTRDELAGVRRETGMPDEG